jgi:hypothetical protein
MPALAEVAGVTQPPTTTGTRVRERDFSAVPEASHGFQRDCGAPLRGVLPLDPQDCGCGFIGQGGGAIPSWS